MKKLINKYAYNAADPQELRLIKSLIVIFAVSCSLCGLVWAGFYYAYFGFGLTSISPLAFVALVVPSIFISHFTNNYKLLVYAQLICIVLVPLFLQFSLGSINDSGFVISWCFLGPLGSLYFLNRTSSLIWMLVFILVVCLSLIGFPPLSADGAKVTENLRGIFYLMNIGTPFIVIFIASSYFLKNLNSQRKANASLLKVAKESNKHLEISLAREKELGELKSSFIAVASHQFRTPLAVIQSNAELLEMLNTSGVKQEPEKYAKVTNRITETISKMTYLMDDVLKLEKLTSGNVFYTPEDIDLVVFCEKLVKKLNFIQRDGRALDFVIDGEAYKLQLDANLLTHSLSNLISNAFNYSVGKENPQLSIHFAPTEVILVIKDYGLGIPEEEQLHLFEPFFGVDNVAEIKGTGLGLSIAKEYVESNKGKISVKSILGEGSCFEITFKR